MLSRSMCSRSLLAASVGAIGLLGPLRAQQQQPNLSDVLARLDRLENQNRELMDEIRALRQQLAGGLQIPAAPSMPSADAAASTPSPAAPLAERVEVQEQRVAQLEQEKISTDHKLPVTLTGMALFNAFMNGRGSGGADNPTVASAAVRQQDGGATLRQSVIGLKFNGADLIGGGRLTGSIYADFFSGNTGLAQTARLRIATLDATWKSTTLTFAFDKPIIAPREPDSLAQVGVSALTSAGNLWLWQPQARIEQRVAISSQSGLRAQFGIYQTSESGTGQSSGEYASTLGRTRPGYEGRFEFWAAGGETRRIEIAPGFHISETHIAGQSIPSEIFSVDWLIRPVARIDLTGTFFQGQNVGVVGGLRQGISVFHESLFPVHSTGGWAQLKFRIAPRITANFYGGQESDRPRDLLPGEIARNLGYAGNIMYRLGTNILTGFEASQVHTTYLGLGTRLNQHYDLAIAYLF